MEKAFSSYTEITQYMELYYQNPNPTKVPQAIDFLNQQGNLGACNVAVLLTNQPYDRPVPPSATFIGVLSMLFRIHSEKVVEWVKACEILPEGSLRGIIEAVWLSGTSEGRLAIEYLKNSVNKVSDFVSEIMKIPPVNIDTFIPTTAYGFDLLWIAFCVTGKSLYVEHLLDSVALIEKSSSIEARVKEALYKALEFSVISQVEAHPQIRDVVLNYCKSVPVQSHKIFQTLIKALNIAKNASFSPSQIFPEE